MIKDVMSSGRYVQVSSSGGSTYINNYSGSIGVGNIRYNTSNQNMEVYDGNNWMTLNMGFANVGLTSEAESLLDWAREQRNKQYAYEAMAKEHPAVQKALEALKRAEEQVDLIYKLSKEEYENEGVMTSP